MGHVKTIARNSLWSLADSVLGLIVSIGCSIAVARMLGPEQTGYYQLVTFMANMAGWIAAFGIPAATRTYAAEAIGKGDYGLARAIVEITFRIQLYLALLATAVCLVAVFILVPPGKRDFAVLSVASILPLLMYTIPSSGITATEDLAPNVRASIVSAVINGGGTVLSLALGWNLIGLAGSMLASRVADFVLRQIFYKQIFARFPGSETPRQLPPELKQKIIQFCKQATYMTVLEIVVWERSELFFLPRYSSMSEVTFFNQPFNWASQLLLFFPKIVATAAGASIAVQHGRDPKQTAGLAIGSTRVLALISLPAAFGMSALAGPLILTALKQPYAPAIPVLALIAVLMLGKALQLPPRQLLTSTGRQHMLVWWGTILGVVNIALDRLLIPSHGAMGAAVAKGTILVAGGVSIWWMTASSFKVRLPLASVARMALASAVMFVAVRALAKVLHPAQALVVGPLVGIAIIVVLYRVLRCLDPADQQVLNAIGRRLPARARPAWTAMVGFMFPSAPRSGVEPGAAA